MRIYSEQKVEESVVPIEAKHVGLVVHEQVGGVLELGEVELDLDDAEVVVEGRYLLAQDEQVLDEEELAVVGRLVLLDRLARLEQRLHAHGERLLRQAFEDLFLRKKRSTIVSENNVNINK